MKKLTTLATVLAFALSSNAMAAESASQSTSKVSVKPIVLMGYAFGGEDMGSLEYDDGTSTDISAGGGFTLGGGLDLDLSNMDLGVEKDMGVRLTGNYHFDSATASNADVTFDRFEFSVMPYVQLNEKISVSAGISLHTGVEFTAEFDGQSDETLEFDGATALVAEFVYKYSDQLSWAVRATSVDYEASTINGRSLDGFDTDAISGSNVGAFMIYTINR